MNISKSDWKFRMQPGKIKIITNHSSLIHKWIIYLDDTDISKFVTGILLDATAGDMPYITLALTGIPEIVDEFSACINIEDRDAMQRALVTIQKYDSKTITEKVATDDCN